MLTYTTTTPCPHCSASLEGRRLGVIDLCPSCKTVLDASSAHRAALLRHLITFILLVVTAFVVAILAGGVYGSVTMLSVIVYILFAPDHFGRIIRMLPPLAVTDGCHAKRVAATMYLLPSDRQRPEVLSRIDALRAQDPCH